MLLKFGDVINAVVLASANGLSSYIPGLVSFDCERSTGSLKAGFLPFLTVIHRLHSLSATLDTFDLVDVAEVVAAIRASPSKQCQLDSRPTWLLRDCIALLAPSFTRLSHVRQRTNHRWMFPDAVEACYCVSPVEEVRPRRKCTNKLSASFQHDLPFEIV